MDYDTSFGRGMDSICEASNDGKSNVIGCVCPKCPKSCVVVYLDRGVLMNHSRSAADHEGFKMPPDDELEWVPAVRTMHKSRVRWVRADSVVSIACLPQYCIEGFRFKSKYERQVKLLDRWKGQFESGHAGFELGAIGRDLKFMNDATLFLKRVEQSAKKARYKVRQFAKRQQDGRLPIVGFNCLHCENSIQAYARTIARFLFFLTHSVQSGTQLQSACDKLAGLHASDAECPARTQAVDALIFEAATQEPCEAGFAFDVFVQLYYFVAPNGFLNRSADFVRHICVHLIYSMRGAYVLKCGLKFDAAQHQDWSEKFLNELHDNAFSDIQSAKRVAASLVENFDVKIQWQADDALEVQTDRGNVAVTVSAIRSMYHDLLRRSRKLLSDLSIPVISQEVLDVVVDVNTKKPGEGIMSMNEAAIRAYLKQHPDLEETIRSPLRSVRAKTEFCSSVYALGKLLTLALYLSGGPSARMTEISSWIIANTDDSHMRNVRFVRGAIAITNTYSKSEGVSGGLCGTQQNLACFSDTELTLLVLTYLIVLKRFELLDIQEIDEFGSDAMVHSRLCFLVNKGNPVKAESLGKIFRDEFLSHGLDVSIADMRHVLEAFARREGCCLAAELESNPLLHYANHESKTSNGVYGKSGLDLPEIPADRMEQCFRYSEHWNQAILGTVTRRVSKVPVGKTVASSVAVVAATTTNTAATVVEAPARGGTAPQGSTSISSVPAYNCASTGLVAKQQAPPASGSMVVDAGIKNSGSAASHHALLWVQKFQSQARSNTKRELNEGQQHESILQAERDENLCVTQPSLKRQRTADRNSLEGALQLLGLARLKDTQLLMMEHLKENHGMHSLLVLPTGSGKSKVVFIDALRRGVCNVIFVPYLPIGDGIWEEGIANPHLTVVRWASIRQDMELAAVNADVVIASFEHSGQSMVSFFQLLHKRGRLGYCFVDEVDVVLHTFRVFKNFWTLAASCPLVKMKAMTATLRPGDKLQVSKMLGIDIHHFKELRQSSRRSEVAISSRFYQDKRALLLGLRTYVMNVSKIPASRVLIFVMTVKEAEDVGDILGQDHPSEVSICYSRRRDVVKRFAVATSCFGHGVNVAGLTHVVVLRSSWSVEGFVQVGN